MLVKPSNERSLWGTAEDKRPQWKNSHVSASIMPNPCLVHPLLWQGERKSRVEMMRGRVKERDEVQEER